MRALRLVDAKEVDLSVLIRKRHTDVGAVDGIGPVSDAISIDLAAQNADGR